MVFKLTGAAEGKILLRGFVELVDDSAYRLDCDIYLHVKGYSLARVTHVDLENPVLNKIVKPKKAMYLPFKVGDSKIIIYLKKMIRINNPNITVKKISIYCPELADALGENESSYVYVGGKFGGVFLGFKKDFIKKLEALAEKYHWLVK